MDYRLNLKDLSNPQDVARLITAISEIADECDVLYTTTDPNSNISGRQGRIALYKNGANYEIKVNTDGAKAWQRVDYGAATDVKVKASSDDPTADYLDGKVDDATIQISAEKLAVKAIDAAKITTGTVATARLGSGSASASTFLRGDQTYATPPDVNTSNCLFCYTGWDPGMGASGFAEYTGTTEEGVTMTYRHLYNTDGNPQVCLKAKFIKVSGINTVTILARLKNTAGLTAATLTVNIGGQSASVSRTATTFDWATANTIDVSGLTNGTTYDITFTLNADGTPLCSAIMLFGS